VHIVKAIVGVAVFVLTAAALAGAWAYFEWMAPVVSGEIKDKQERIIGGRHAAPGRYLSIAFTLLNETEQDRYLYGSPAVTDVRVDERMFAAAMVGESVRLKYLPFNPRFARLADQPVIPPTLWMFVAAAAVALIALLVKRARTAVVLCCGFTAALLVAIPGPPSSQLAVAGAAGVVLIALVAAVVRKSTARVLVGTWMPLMAAAAAWWVYDAGRGETRTAMADVGEVREFRTPTSSRARYAMMTLQEFDRVHASFIPERGAERVFLLDFVDRGSTARLSEGSRVMIKYKTATPEGARLAAGTRTHYWKNAAVPVGVLLLATWWATRTGKTRSRTRDKRTTAQST
jgi:hypothetical protein